MWESQKKSWEDAFLKQNGYTQTKRNQTTTKKGMQQTEQKATNASPSLKLSSIKKKITPASPL